MQKVYWSPCFPNQVSACAMLQSRVNQYHHWGLLNCISETQRNFSSVQFWPNSPASFDNHQGWWSCWHPSRSAWICYLLQFGCFPLWQIGGWPLHTKWILFGALAPLVSPGNKSDEQGSMSSNKGKNKADRSEVSLCTPVASEILTNFTYYVMLQLKFCFIIVFCNKWIWIQTQSRDWIMFSWKQKSTKHETNEMCEFSTWPTDCQD